MCGAVGGVKDNSKIDPSGVMLAQECSMMEKSVPA
jgi:hypothetical protein